MAAQAAGDAPTLAGLRGVLRPAPAPEAAVVVTELVRRPYDDYRRPMKARDYSAETLRHHLVSRNWMVGFEAWSGAVPDPATYDLEQHDRLLVYLREMRKLAPNTVYTAIKDLKSFLRWLRDERGVPIALELRKLVTKPFDAPKLYLSAGDLEQLAAAPLPANLVATRDVFWFCCCTRLRYSDVVALHAGNLHAWDGGRRLPLIQSKTRVGVSIYLTAAALAILDKYADERVRLLPAHPNQVLSKYLKLAAKLAGAASYGRRCSRTRRCTRCWSIRPRCGPTSPRVGRAKKTSRKPSGAAAAG